MNRLSRKALLALVFLLVVFELQAQTFEYNTNPKGIRLPVQSVLQLEQDSLGRIWMSTPRGIFYSDGVETLALPDTILSEFEYQVRMHQDEEGMIWLYDARGEGNFWKGGYGAWQKVVFDGVDSLVNESRIRFSTRGKGAEMEYALDLSDRFLYWKEGGSPLIFDKVSNDSGVFTQLGGDSDHPVFFFLKASYQLQDRTFKKIHWDQNIIPTAPALVKQSPETGEYYFLGPDFLAKGPDLFHPKEILDRDIKPGFSLPGNLLGLEFSKGSVFYHFNSDLIKISYGSERPLDFDMEETFRVFHINDFLIDREGILWLATSRGIANVNSLAFQNYNSALSGLMSQEVTAIGALQGDEYLFGYNNGIQKISRNLVKEIFKNSGNGILPTSRVVNFSKENDQILWFSANIKGVGRYDDATERVELFAAPDNRPISSVQVFGDTLLITSPFTVYLSSTKNRGNSLFENSLQEELQELMNHKFFYLRKASKLKDGRILLMRASRLENTENLIETEDYLVADGYDFLETPEGILLGTESGLKIIRNSKVMDYRIGEETVSRPVFSLLMDSSGVVWCGTDDGIYRITKHAITHYNHQNGLANNETNRGALVEGVAGRIMVGTLDGFSIFKPNEQFVASGGPKIHIKSLLLEGESILDREDVRGDFSQNSLQVEYAAVGFNEEKELWVHYRLKGFEDEWTLLKEPKSQRIFYPSLPAGTFQFEIKSSYEGKEESAVRSSHPFTVLQPFYLRFWFLALVSVFLVGVGFFVKSFFDQLQKLGVLESAVSRKDKEKLKAEVQFKNVWDSSKDGLLLSLNGEVIVAANPSFASFIGTLPKALEGQTLCQVLKDEELVGKFQQSIDQLPESGSAFDTKIYMGLDERELEIFSKPIPTEGQNAELILSVFRDVTFERKIEKRLREAKEKAEEANRFKTSLLSNVSHEIRTPLNVILGGTEHIMMTRKDDQRLVEELELILQSGERLLSTISSILDMAKIEANKMEVIYSEFDLLEFISMVMKPFFAHAERKGIHLKLDLRKKIIMGRTDKRFLEMILNNLLGNSLKYSESGTVKVTVDHQDDYLLVKIEDEGVGMGEEFLGKVFQPFEQESTGHQRQFEGTGLGMSITKSLLDLLGGTIVLESAKNQGTRVIVEIPLSDS
ncbi:ATP-binding protein [Algoriphagus vanfongensis]|uniref:sensor histidine kinase n=1 Tax=Algoriphagus vanfongensis TaxID=426371 RepID=UPI0003FA99E9|nr:ATP-binding protein [Algoriphagus vanfongensis]